MRRLVLLINCLMVLILAELVYSADPMTSTDRFSDPKSIRLLPQEPGYYVSTECDSATSPDQWFKIALNSCQEYCVVGKGDFSKTFEAIDQVLAATASSPLLQAKALILKAECHKWLREYSEVIVASKKAINLLGEKTSDQPELVKPVLMYAYFDLGVALHEKSFDQAALAAFEKIIKQCTGEQRYLKDVFYIDSEEYLVGFTEIWRARCYISLENESQAREILEQARKDFSDSIVYSSAGTILHCLDERRNEK